MKEKYSIGHVFKSRRYISEADVKAYAKVTGDNNPIHTNLTEAKKTIFKKRIAHGFLLGSEFSRIFGIDFPGTGTIYLSQTMKFVRPVYLDTWIEAVVKIIDYEKEKSRIKFETVIFNDSKEPAIIGEAIVKHP